MSSGNSNSGTNNTKGSQTSVNANPNSSNGNNSSNPISLTPRFTNEEKETLYSLFQFHEEVIDIKYRKKQKGKYSVREAWQQIVDSFNSHPSVTTQRNLKQLQKFWLNARLRKQYPASSQTNSNKLSTMLKNESTINTVQQTVVKIPQTIKCEPEYALAGSETPDTTHNDEEYEEIELHPSTVSDPLNVDEMDEMQEAQHQIQQQTQQIHQQQPQQTIQTQQISVDQISAEKLTLNDLLHFKNTRPRDEIILQIKHPESNSITLPSPTRITIPHQQSATATYNQIMSEIKTQSQQIQVQQCPTPQIQIQQQTTPHVTPQHQVQQHFTSTTPTYCSFTTHSVPQVPASSNLGQSNSTTTSYLVTESFEEKINYFKLKEAELRYKEQQLQLEQKRLDLNRVQEELKHQKEIHRLQLDEMRIKIRILIEEEKQLQNKES